MATNNLEEHNSTATETVDPATTPEVNDGDSRQEPSESAQQVDTPSEDVTAEQETGTGTAPTDVPAADTAATASAPRSGGRLAGAGAVISAALGLVSLTGSPVSEMLRMNARISGQIQSQTNPNANQIDMLYSTPWHTAALSNGVIALIAVLIGGGVLAAFLRADSQRWVKPVALGGAVLGLLGVLLAGGMYFDLFASAPTLPKMPTMGGMGR